VKVGGRTFALSMLTGLMVIALGSLAFAIAFGTAPAPETMESVSAPMGRVDYSDLPEPSHFMARDGTLLTYRAYNPEGAEVAVLIHGSSGESSAMHALARAVAAAGYAVYVPDLRGHARDGRLGDIDYLGQLDDDLIDLMQLVGGAHPRASVALVGHSSGGGFVLRFAEGPDSGLFSRFVLLAPALHYGAPTWRPGAGGWARPFVARIVALTILDRVGVTWFQHLPIVAFAVSRTGSVRLAPNYSFVMQRNFSAPADDLERLDQVRAPLTVLIGEKDEIFYADRFAALLTGRRPDTRVEVVPGVDHMELTTLPAGTAAVVAALR
jgi:non-heme chloroperoxidase